MTVFFELMVYKGWADSKPKPEYVRNRVFISSDKDFESLQQTCREKTKDMKVNVRVECEIDNNTGHIMSEEEFFKRLSKAYLTMNF